MMDGFFNQTMNERRMKRHIREAKLTRLLEDNTRVGEKSMPELPVEYVTIYKSKLLESLN